MIAPDTLCRIVHCYGEWAALNNRIVQVIGYRGAGVYEFAPDLPSPFPGSVAAYAHERHLQPISDPDSCKTTDADIYARQPETSNA